jgi:hypothetical protein
MSTEEKNERFVLLPAVSGGGVLVRRSQIVGARPNGQDGAIVYTAAGPSLYTSLTTRQVAGVVSAELIEQQ